MSFNSLSQVKIGLRFDHETLVVGRLARRDSKIYWEYDRSFIDSGIEISPIQCALRSGVQTFDALLFDGLPGVFNDSLPDGWGRLVLDRYLRGQGIMPEVLSPLDRLAYVGLRGMGALVYEPDCSLESSEDLISMDLLALHAQAILAGNASDVIESLIAWNGSSAGARPKAMIGLHTNRKDIIYGRHEPQADYQPWLVKFPNSVDGMDSGAIEYVYALMALEAGLDMPDIHLFESKRGSGYFAVRRFDRQGDQRLHMHTACGLLHSDFRVPSLDYEDLMALTMILTKDQREVEKIYRMAVFNVLAHNRDDHGKNFSFLMDKMGAWKLSPAYDLTFSSGLGGEQSTMVLGEGKNPRKADLVKLGLQAKLAKNNIHQIIEQAQSALSQWKKLAKNYGVSCQNISLIESKMAQSGV